MLPWLHACILLGDDFDYEEDDADDDHEFDEASIIHAA